MSEQAAGKNKGWSILQKGLIIISIPLLFEVFFVIVLVHLLDQASENANVEMDSQDKIACVETIIKEVSDSTISAALYNATRRNDLKQRHEASRARFFRTYRRLTKLVAKDPEEIRAAQQIYSGVFILLAQQDQQISQPQKQKMSDILDFGTGSAQGMLVLRPEGPAKTILDKEERIQASAPENHRRSVFLIQILFFVGFVVNSVITIFLAVYFATYVSSRLQNILTNTLKLGARMPLDPPLRGDDELAELDHALHSAASDILSFERFREQLIAMVSHELRTPLTSVQGTLTLLEIGALGPVNEKSLQKISKTQHHLKNLIELINNLLLLERFEAGTQIIRPEKLELGSIVRQACQNKHEEFAEKNIAVVLETDDLSTMGDGEHLLQAFEILLQNCLHRSSQGERVRINGKVIADRVEIKLIDSGSPLSPSVGASYFERTRELLPGEEKGLILLLALSKAILVAHEGSISAVSEGSTTSFVVRLPMRRPIAAQV